MPCSKRWQSGVTPSRSRACTPAAYRPPSCGVVRTRTALKMPHDKRSGLSLSLHCASVRRGCGHCDDAWRCSGSSPGAHRSGRPCNRRRSSPHGHRRTTTRRLHASLGNIRRSGTDQLTTLRSPLPNRRSDPYESGRKPVAFHPVMTQEAKRPRTVTRTFSEPRAFFDATISCDRRFNPSIQHR
jgi:hypothetical protein